MATRIAIRLSLPLLLSVTLAACSVLQLAESLDQRLAVAYATHTAVLNATTAALDAGTITSADAINLAELADRARQVLDSARTVSAAGRTADAERQLVLAAAILLELQTYLRGLP